MTKKLNCTVFEQENWSFKS